MHNQKGGCPKSTVSSLAQCDNWPQEPIPLYVCDRIRRGSLRLSPSPCNWSGPGYSRTNAGRLGGSCPAERTSAAALRQARPFDRVRRNSRRSIVVTVAEGKTTHGPLGMICHKADIRRKERLVELMDVHANVGPPKECLDERSAIVKAHLQFNVSPSRMQTDAMHAL